MSTRDPLPALIPAVASLPEALRASIEGVSLAAYLFVEAARLDGLPLTAVLAWLGVRESAFAAAEEGWSDALAGELAREGSGFDQLYEELLGRALSFWARPVPPLDREVTAWMAFQRHALAAPDPEALARRAGLTAGDELRLSRLWRSRLGDPEVAARATAALSGPLPAMPQIAVAAFTFPPIQAGSPASPGPQEPA